MSFSLRHCQIDAFDCVKKRFESRENETNLSLCTGAGKSKIIRLCSTDIASAKRVIIVFPSLLLLKQYYKDSISDYKGVSVYYLATEGTLAGIPRLGESVAELDGKSWCVLTTYVSAPIIYSKLFAKPNIIIHDEAHHIIASQYATALSTFLTSDIHCINLSATLPVKHYRIQLTTIKILQLQGNSITPSP